MNPEQLYSAEAVGLLIAQTVAQIAQAAVDGKLREKLSGEFTFKPVDGTYVVRDGWIFDTQGQVFAAVVTPVPEESKS